MIPAAILATPGGVEEFIRFFDRREPRGANAAREAAAAAKRARRQERNLRVAGKTPAQPPIDTFDILGGDDE